ncbi:MAG: nuclear transport factor 2 family protein [Anaerolineales bacterium]
MDNVDIIARYFERFFSGKARHSDVRSLLTDDFTFHGPLMAADGADEYVAQLQSFGDEMEMHARVRQLIGSDDIVAALVDFDGPGGAIPYAQWFTLREGKISRLEVVYDPRPFLSAPTAS